MSETASEVRLVRCPKCENLLPEVTEYAVYQCGGCFAVLRVGRIEDAHQVLDEMLEITGDSAQECISEVDLTIRVIVSCIRVRHEFTRHEFDKHEHGTNFNSCLRYQTRTRHGPNTNTTRTRHEFLFRHLRFGHRKQLSDEKKSTGNDNEFEDPNYQDNQQQNNTNNTNNNNVSVSKSSACSSTLETSKGSGLSLSRSENRVRARERARDMAAKKEKEKDGDPVRVVVVTQVNGISHKSSFTDLLTGISNTAVNPNNSSNPTANSMQQPSLSHLQRRQPSPANSMQQPSPSFAQVSTFSASEHRTDEKKEFGKGAIIVGCAQCWCNGDNYYVLGTHIISSNRVLFVHEYTNFPNTNTENSCRVIRVVYKLSGLQIARSNQKVFQYKTK
ncbi:hypothetical protein LXL04_009086 [Taraxacum kok-saghyz]